MKAWFVYILFCDNKTFYIGLTSNLQNRLLSHKNKYNLATKKYSDIKLVYTEKYGSRKMAESRERQLKGWSVAKKKALIAHDIELLKKLSKTRSIVDR